MPVKRTPRHYSRAQMAEKLTTLGYPVSDETIYRWENAGKLSRPKKVMSSGHLLYTDDHVTAAIRFMKETR